MGQCTSGRSESRLRDAFKAAQQQAEQGKRVILFFDEVDALCPRRVSGQDHEVRVVAQMLTLLDGAVQNAGSLLSGSWAAQEICASQYTRDANLQCLADYTLVEDHIFSQARGSRSTYQLFK